MNDVCLAFWEVENADQELGITHDSAAFEKATCGRRVDRSFWNWGRTDRLHESGQEKSLQSIASSRDSGIPAQSARHLLA